MIRGAAVLTIGIGVRHPGLVVNGDDDVMVPSFNSFELACRLPKAHLSIFPDAGHGGIFQYHATFVQQALAFLRQEAELTSALPVRAAARYGAPQNRP